MGVPPEDIVSEINEFPGIVGRSNIYHIIDTNSSVVIDYAHTPQSLKNQLDLIRDNIGTKKLVCVFGCGGMKSMEKRPIMGAVAAKIADHVILTNDNPREEHPRKIIMDIIDGIRDLSSVEVYLDREEAIKRTLSNFPNSIILLAGKGNEDMMDIDGHEMPTSDFDILKRWIIQNGFGICGYDDYVE